MGFNAPGTGKRWLHDIPAIAVGMARCKIEAALVKISTGD
jgi:hypothetical protein